MWCSLMLQEEEKNDKKILISGFILILWDDKILNLDICRQVH